MIRTFESDYGKPIINFYGSNEGLALFATPDTAASAELRASHFPRFGVPGLEWPGQTHKAVASKVIDVDTGADVLDPGGVGELCFAGATVFDGYLGTDNSEIFTDDGFSAPVTWWKSAVIRPTTIVSSVVARTSLTGAA